eukprot:gene24818-biopygen16453
MSIPCARPLCSNEQLGKLSAINVRIAGVHMNIFLCSECSERYTVYSHQNCIMHQDGHAEPIACGQLPPKGVQLPLLVIIIRGGSCPASGAAIRAWLLHPPSINVTLSQCRWGALRLVGRCARTVHSGMCIPGVSESTKML